MGWSSSNVSLVGCAGVLEMRWFIVAQFTLASKLQVLHFSAASGRA
jgi:hypothetical protein